MTRDTFEEAERCEKSHLSASSVKELEYRFGTYPFRVALTFPDGNSSDSCRRRSYDIDSIKIYGYGIPDYNPPAN
jgi:hypothetical protein